MSKAAERLAPSAFSNIQRISIAARLALGETPVQVSDGLLSKAEAHAWLLEDRGCSTPREFVVSRLYNRVLAAGQQTFCRWDVRSMRVARWLERLFDTGRWTSLATERAVKVSGLGEPWQVSVLGVLDEVQDANIVTGSDRAEDVLRRIAARKSETWIAEAARDARELASVPAWAATLPRWVRLLRTRGELVREGKEMRHCVAGYAESVERGQCWILAVDVPRWGRSTVELDETGTYVRQHKGPNNGAPPLRNRWLVDAWLRRCRPTKFPRPSDVAARLGMQWVDGRLQVAGQIRGVQVDVVIDATDLA